MFQEIWLEYQKKFRKMLFLFLFLLFGTVIFLYSRQNTLRKNEKKAENILASIDQNKDISNVSQEQLEKLLELNSLKPITKGQIYELMADISYQAANRMEYNTYMTYAIYYYQKAEAFEQIIAQYAHYLRWLYENSGFEAAKQFLDRQNSNQPVTEYKDKQAIAGYYINYAEVDAMLEDSAAAKEMLEVAGSYLEEITDSPHYLFLLAKYHIQEARLALSEGETKEASAILSSFDENEILNLPEGTTSVSYDLILPYHELMGKIMLLQDKETEAIRHIDFYLEYCSENRLYMVQYRILKDILAEYTDKLSKKDRKRYQEEFTLASERNITYLSTDHCEELVEQLELTKNQLDIEEKQELNYQLIKYGLLILLYVGLIVWTMIQYCMLYIHTDPLTRLTVRSQYDRQRNILEKRKITYFLLILDIDNFKSVNDTYGHLAGDTVLKQIASLIKNQLAPRDHAFRYGGEEFCVILQKDTLDEAYQAADSIRLEINRFPWNTLIPELSGPLSVSGGLAEAKNGKNPFQQADQFLYYSKDHGKNRITTHSQPQVS